MNSVMMSELTLVDTCLHHRFTRICRLQKIFLISNFRLFLNVVFFLLGDTPPSEFYVPKFRDTFCFIFIGIIIIPAYTAYEDSKKDQVIPLQARCGPEGG